jgi:1-deoxy-D-xylulose-5-phosphate reductoisomerase
VAVHAFLAGRLRFLDIAAVIEETLARLPATAVHSFDSLAGADAQARRMAAELVAGRAAA